MPENCGRVAGETITYTVTSIQAIASDCLIAASVDLFWISASPVNHSHGGNDMYALARYIVSAYNPSAPIYSDSQDRLFMIQQRSWKIQQSMIYVKIN